MAENEIWWAGRWLDLIKRETGKDFTKLRSRSRKSVCQFFETAQGEVKAKIGEGAAEGSFIKIYLETLDEAAWAEITSAMASQSVWEAGLRAGVMPDNIERVFEAAGKPFFPSSLTGLRSFCAKHGEEVFCFHAAAIHFRFAEEFARNPFLLFECRGLPKEKLLSALSASALTPPSAVSPKTEAPRRTGFWTSQGDLSKASARFKASLEQSGPAEALSPSPFMLRGKNLSELLGCIHTEAAKQAAEQLEVKL